MSNYFKILDDKFKNQEPQTIVQTKQNSSELNDVQSLYVLTEKLNQDIQNQKMSYDKEKKKLIDDQKEKLMYLSQLYSEAKLPLDEMFTMIDMLKESNLSADQVRYLNILRTSLDFVSTRVQQANDFSQVESGDFHPEFAKFNMQNIIFETYEYFKLKAQDKSGNLTLVMPDNFWQFYKSDSFRIGQLLNRVLTNAIEFSHYGDIDFIVETSKRFGTMVELKFIIKDIGNGLKMDKFSKIFQQVKVKYGSNIVNQTHEMEKSDFNVIAKIARYMGGELKIESGDYQGGIQFTITLPLEVANK